MSLVPPADIERAMDRLAAKQRELQFDEDRATYYFLVLGMLGSNAPDVLTFFLDRADSILEGA